MIIDAANLDSLAEMYERATIAIPTRGRRGYLEVALASIAPQAANAGVEVLVIDDGAAEASVADLAASFGAHYAAHNRPLGLNAARNTAVQRSRGELIIFVDDDVEACPGWLEALLSAAGQRRDRHVFTGPIIPRLEGCAPRSCGREEPPITSLYLGEADSDEVRFAWGANMAVRRSAFASVGLFDASLSAGGDEQDWQERLIAQGGGPVRYVAAAVLVHRRDARDSRLRALLAASHQRGRGSRRFDAHRGQAPSVPREALTMLGCLGHVVSRRCPNGLTMLAHSAGRLREALDSSARSSEAKEATEQEPFLSGQSGTVGGVDALRRRARDRVDTGLEIISARRAKLALAARSRPQRRAVLVLGVEREERAELAHAIRAELGRSRHAIEVVMERPAGRGKFEAINAMLERHPAQGFHWLIVLDDDIRLPRGFLDRFLFLAERFALDLAQPAHWRASHAAWQVTRRRRATVARQTAFVEIGPLTAFASRTFETLLPFPDLKMGWGLDMHWAALARQKGWRCGVIDATPIAHIAAPAAQSYSRASAIAEGRAFLAERPHISAAEAEATLASYRSWR